MTPVLKKLGNSEDAVWIFRILNQINQLSQGAPLGTSDRAEFESAHLRLFELLRQCNDARRELIQLVQQHIEDVSVGRSVAVIGSGHIRIEDDIEPKLNRIVNSFFVAARTVLYHLFGQREDPSKGPHTKSATEILTRYNLSFVHIHNDAKFEQAAARYLAFDTSRMAAHLMDVIRGDRKSWSLGLQDIRDTIIHDTRYLGLKVIYKANGNKVAIGFPRLNGVEMIEFVELFWKNLVDAVEEITIASLATRMSSAIAIVPIPEEEWNPELPFRWRGVLLNTRSK
jgi:hypothetical protein